MSKAILVIDMPSSCYECPLRIIKFKYLCETIIIDFCNSEQKEIPKEHFYNMTRPDWCPLKSIPEKKHQPQYCGNGVFGYRTAMEHEHARGWNECIDYFVGK